MIAALAARGPVSVSIPCIEDHRGHHGDPVRANVFAGPIPPRRPSWLREYSETWWGRRQHLPSCDLIWERYSLLSDAGSRHAQRHGVPRLVELNAPLSLERPGLRHPRRAHALEARILRSADRVIAVSSWLASWATELGCADVRHVPNGSACRDGDRARGRALIDVGEGLLIGFVGSLRPWHGVELLPTILDALGPDAHALVLGQGAAPPHPRLHALGAVPPAALPNLIAALDVGLAPYALDAPPWFCPLKILDYLAVGVPIVASDVADCASLIGDRGCLLTSREPRAWARAIRHAASLPRIPQPRPWSRVVTEALDGLVSSA